MCGKSRVFLKVQEMGLEPTRIATADFESAASTIPPLLRCSIYVITSSESVQIIPQKSVDTVFLS